MWVTHTPLLCTYIVSLVGAAAALIERVRCWYLPWVTMWVTHTRSDGQCVGTRFIASAGWEGLASALTWAHLVRPSRRCPDQCVKPHHRAHRRFIGLQAGHRKPVGPSAKLAERVSILRGHRRFIGLQAGHRKPVGPDLSAFRRDIDNTQGPQRSFRSAFQYFA